MILKNKKNKGFTLIELLVVIAIIGILSSIVLASLNTARSKARDAKRKTELKSLTTALELYKNQVGSYPLCPGSNPATSTYTECLVNAIPGMSTYISSLPIDPVNDASTGYQYWYQSNGTYSAVTFRAENRPSSEPSTQGFRLKRSSESYMPNGSNMSARIGGMTSITGSSVAW